jgi:hypothetical protein
MVTVIKYSDTIPPQEYEKKRDEVIKLLTRMNGHLLSLDFLNYHLKLDEKYLPAYVVSRMVDEGIPVSLTTPNPYSISFIGTPV